MLITSVRGGYSDYWPRIPQNLARPLSRCQSGRNDSSVRTEPGADTGFVGPEAYKIGGGPL